MEQTLLLFTEHQLNVLQMIADVLSYLPPEERRDVMEAALDEVNADD